MKKRKIIINLAVSLDWFIEWKNWEYDWCLTDRDYWMDKFLSEIDTMFMWRKSYELFSWDMKEFFPEIKQIVFSTTLKEKNLIIINENIFDKVNKLKNQEWKDIWLFGWAKLIKSLIGLKLIDEINILIHPLILWWWTPLFLWFEERIKLELIDSEKYSSWWLVCRYKFLY